MKPTINDCKLLDLLTACDGESDFSAVTSVPELPFTIERCFYIYDIPAGDSRGRHAHKECEQFIVAARGSFDLVLDDGSNTQTIVLDRPYKGVYVPAGIWTAEENFAAGSVCLVFASHPFDEADYIRDYLLYLDWIDSKSPD